MKPCPNCHFKNSDDAVRCFKCNGVLEHVGGVNLSIPVKRKVSMSIFTKAISNIWFFIQRLHSSPLPTTIEKRSPWIAGWLSFIPGLGQLYNHQMKKAFLFFLYFAVLLFVSLITIKNPFSNFILLGFLGYMLFLFNDGFSTAIAINGTRWDLRNKLAVLSYLFFMFGILFLMFEFFGGGFFDLITIREEAMRPAFEKYDRIAIESITHRFRPPRRGEIVCYDPDMFTLIIAGTGEGEIPSSVNDLEWRYDINMANNVERIIAMPGEKVVIKDRVIYVNGEELDQKYYPLKTTYLLSHRYEVPEDTYLILITHSPQDTLYNFFPTLERDPDSTLQNVEIGKVAPDFGDEGIIFDESYFDACLVRRDQFIGRAICIYNPPRRRKFLIESPNPGL